MKGVVFLGKRQCAVRDVPVPAPGEGEVLLRVEATGICGSDLHVYRADQGSEQVRGHEPCGVVEAVGAGLANLKVGDRVTVHHHQGCGVCAQCARGEFVCCGKKKLFGVSSVGSFAEYTVARERACVPLADSMTFTDGAFLACVGGTSYAALRRLDARRYESLAVFGLGPVGLSAVLVGKALGLRVMGVDILPERIEVAARCGADRLVNAANEDPVAIARKFGDSGGVDYVIETSGSAPARRNIIPSLRREGKAAIVGVGSNEAVINPSDIHGRAVTLIGSVVFPIAWMWDLVTLCRRSGLSFEPAVTHRFPLEEAPKALQLADGGRCGKVLFVPHGRNRS